MDGMSGQLWPEISLERQVACVANVAKYAGADASAVVLLACDRRVGHERCGAGASFDRGVPEQDDDGEKRGREEVRLAESALHPLVRREGRSRTGDDVERGNRQSLGDVPHRLESQFGETGDTITVELFPAKNGAPVGRLARITQADGRELLDSLYKDSPFDTIQRK
jgi:hypothetical protein